MSITQSQLEFFLQIAAVLTIFYRAAKFEAQIHALIKGLEHELTLHKNQHELLDYQLAEIKSKLDDHHELLKNNNCLKRSTD
ncbi:hypothetical protein A0J48_006985 [Sphaerospermopsis aphanizomenoides BCCUSP55]|uniref:hypothetical protein n=1 Tax=Sphaerospermopsis aphanizomenoides TaxID=459663 RepID=UPI001903DB5C|nr:hypothetical protein [Sphaerospermopsis aphanizomenoides]MBK1987281.1 hypothetical protein [Sphaerospermopsis aphanizomenoides BCCUSP55]